MNRTKRSPLRVAQSGATSSPGAGSATTRWMMMWGKVLEGIHGKFDVGVLRQRDVVSGAVGPLERRIPADIDVMQLDPVDGQGVEAADGGVHVVRRFTGKAEHEVRADLHVGFFRQLNGPGRGRRVVPPVDAAQGGVRSASGRQAQAIFLSTARRRG